MQGKICSANLKKLSCSARSKMLKKTDRDITKNKPKKFQAKKEEKNKQNIDQINLLLLNTTTRLSVKVTIS